ncbi:MAG: DUF58 domain-containing protein [Chloroflexi bacterium]|nr:DUF58 domain-containing protein [Chloroflexota bacterium]
MLSPPARTTWDGGGALAPGDWPPLPLDRRWLERQALEYRQEYRAGLTGAHLTRRHGQSLEIRELVHYTPGDDIRHVDWRASARHGLDDSQRWLARRFVAEEQLTLAVSLDARHTMLGPPGAEKLLVGLWLAEALAVLTLHGSDRIILHPLYSQRSQPAEILKGSSDNGRVRTALRRLRASVEPPPAPSGWRQRLRPPPPPPPPCLNVDVLWPQLPPTAIWIVVTDGYLPPADRDALARRMTRAAEGSRWVMLVELDSWPAERAALGTGARRIDGPGLPGRQPELEIDGETVRKVEREIETGLEPLRRAARAHVHWSWPAEREPAIAERFGDWFRTERRLHALFRRPG